ncbi:MAG: hypothetical protein WKF61_04690 [Luteimonas sp.]
MATRYYLSLPNPEKARGGDVAYAFTSRGADGFASELQDALRSDALFQRWRAAQADPDGVDASLGATDSSATVTGQQDDLHIDLIATTSIPGSVFKHRLRLLAGSAWELRDVSAA